MTTRPIHDNIVQDLKARIACLEKQVRASQNNPTVAIPIRTATNLPTEAYDGEIVIGDDNRAWKFKDDEWTVISNGLLDQITTPGTLRVFDGDARSYMTHAGTVKFVHSSVGVSPVGGSVGFELVRNLAVTIGTGSIGPGEHVDTFVPSPGAFQDGDFFTVNITSIGGTSVPGKSLVVKLF